MTIARSVLLIILGTAACARDAEGQTSGGNSPLTLMQVLDSVSRTHPLIQAADARVRAARGARSTAGRLGNPMLAYQVENVPLGSGSAVPMDREVMTMLTLPLEPLYQRGSRVRRADADVRAARADVISEQRRMALDAAGAFYRAALAAVRLDAARDIASLLDTVVTYNRSRVREGVTAESDLIRSELERDRAGAEATMAEADLIQARYELAAFLGDSAGLAGFTIAIDSTPLPFSLTGLPNDSLAIRRALSERTELVAARERVRSATAGIGAERSMLIRQFGVTLGLKRSAGSSSLLAGGSIPFPLFDQNRGEIARATGERDAAAFELASAERSVRAEVAGLLAAARLLTDRMNGQLAQAGPARYLARAAEIRRIALGTYREGAIPLIQVIDAARASADARTAFFATLYAQHQAVLAFFAAQGDDPALVLATLRPAADPNR